MARAAEGESSEHAALAGFHHLHGPGNCAALGGRRVDRNHEARGFDRPRARRPGLGTFGGGEAERRGAADSDAVRRRDAPHRRIVSGNVQKGEEPARARSQADPPLMRLSREKVVQLSHAVVDHLVSSDDVDFIEDRETIRQKIVALLNGFLHEEEKMDADVRKKIASQKKEIPEGSPEWDILFRKYYSEEMKRLGITADR